MRPLGVAVNFFVLVVAARLPAIQSEDVDNGVWMLGKLNARRTVTKHVRNHVKLFL